MKKIEGGITAAKGFEAASAAAHIKYEGRTDMAMVYSEAPCVTAGTFTTNIVKAAPVVWDRELVYSGAPAHAVIVNSGIAGAIGKGLGVLDVVLSSDAVYHDMDASAWGYKVGQVPQMDIYSFEADKSACK